MLKNPPFYHQLTRKAVILFGRIFDDLKVVRKDTSGKEYQRFLVPLVYSPKEKMITRMFSDPDLYRQIQVLLPRMGFEITDISYDATRKQNSLLKIAKTSTNSSNIPTSYMSVPYDMKFDLNIYTRNIDDGTQIIEQILPFFNPDYTVTADMVQDLGVYRDIAIILNSVKNDIQYEGNFDSVRYVNWTLTFTMKMWYYGPVRDTKIIRDVRTNLLNDNTLSPGAYLAINTDGLVGKFKMNDIIYQGNSYKTATAYGILHRVTEGNANTPIRLIVSSTQGIFKTNRAIHCLSTNGTCNVTSFFIQPEVFTKIRIRPDPLTAEPGDDYGYDVEIVEGYWEDYYVTPNTFSYTVLTDNANITIDSTTITTDME